mgnify:CR=1 FL=1
MGVAVRPCRFCEAEEGTAPEVVVDAEGVDLAGVRVRGTPDDVLDVGREVGGVGGVDDVRRVVALRVWRCRRCRSVTSRVSICSTSVSLSASVRPSLSRMRTPPSYAFRDG